MNEMETVDAQSTSKEQQIIKDIHAIWQLTECMFLTSDDEKPLALMLSKWLAIHEFGMDPSKNKKIGCHHR